MDFRITYDDGETYEGRYDLKHWTDEYPNLERHVYDFVRFTAGKYKGALSPEDYDRFKEQAHFKKLSPQFKHFLEKYEIGQLNVQEFNPLSEERVPAPKETHEEKMKRQEEQLKRGEEILKKARKITETPEESEVLKLDELAATEVAEKGWKDFFKGNRIQAMIDSTNYRIKHRNVSEAEQKRLHESLKTDWKDLVEYQKLQSWGFASGLLTKEEAELLYNLYGGESPSPEKWDKLTLAEKVAATKLVDELLAVRLKKGGYSPQTRPITLPALSLDSPFFQSAVIPIPPRREREKDDLQYMADSPEMLAQTIEQSGWRERLDREFQLAIARSRR